MKNENETEAPIKRNGRQSGPISKESNGVLVLKNTTTN